MMNFICKNKARPDLRFLAIFVCIFLIEILFNSCLSKNWSSQNKTISFLPNIIKRLENTSKPILLNEEEKKELFSSLKGSVKKDFLSDNLSPDVKIYWYETTKGKFKNAFTILRVTKDKKRYYSLDYKLNGRIFSAGGGRVEDSEWMRKWIE